MYTLCPTEDEVYIPFEDQREEYVQNDSGLLFMGTAKNLVSRPWSFDQVREKYLIFSIYKSLQKCGLNFVINVFCLLFNNKVAVD